MLSAAHTTDSLHNAPHAARSDIIDPTADCNVARNQVLVLEVLDVVTNGLVQVRKCQEIKRGNLGFCGRPKALLDKTVGAFVGKGQHAAAGMLDQDDLFGAQVLLGYNNGPQSLARAGAGVSNDMRVAQVDAEGRSSIDTSIHAGDYESLRSHQQVFLGTPSGGDCFLEDTGKALDRETREGALTDEILFPGRERQMTLSERGSKGGIFLVKVLLDIGSSRHCTRSDGAFVATAGSGVCMVV